MLKIALICTGNHAHAHHGPSLRDYRKLHPDEVELTGVCDLDREGAQEFAEAYGFQRVYSDYRRMIDSETPDALIAISAVPKTFSMAGDLLSYGIPLLIEKPPGETAEETRALLGIARRHDTAAMISFNRRFNPALTVAKDWMTSLPGENPPDLVMARMLRVARREREFIVRTGIHLVDATLSLMGRPEAAASTRWESPLGGQCCAGSITTAGGTTAQLCFLPDCGALEETYEVSGPEYSIRIDVGGTQTDIYHRGELVLEWRPELGVEAHMRNGAFHETAAFVELVSSGGSPYPSLEDGLYSMRTAEALEAGGRSAIAG